MSLDAGQLISKNKDYVMRNGLIPIYDKRDR